jgi:hypothetical protein
LVSGIGDRAPHGSLYVKCCHGGTESNFIYKRNFITDRKEEKKIRKDIESKDEDILLLWVHNVYRIDLVNCTFQKGMRKKYHDSYQLIGTKKRAKLPGLELSKFVHLQALI